MSKNTVKIDSADTAAKKPAYDFFKRAFDIVFSLLALLVLFVPFIIISIIIIIDSPGAGPIHVQTRVGKNGKAVLLCQLFQYRVKLVTVRAMPLHKQHHLPVGQVNLPAVAEAEPAGGWLFCPG